MFRWRLWVSVQLTTCWWLAAVPHLQNWNVTTGPVILFFFTDCILSPSATVGFLETSYDDTYEATSSSRARTLSKYSLDGAPLGLSPFSHHRSVKKHLSASLVSSRTSASRVDTGPRVCPFCPAVDVPSQDLILVCLFGKEKKRCILLIKAKNKKFPLSYVWKLTIGKSGVTLNSVNPFEESRTDNPLYFADVVKDKRTKNNNLEYIRGLNGWCDFSDPIHDTDPLMWWKHYQ